MRILLVEDDHLLGRSVQNELRHDGFIVDWVQDGQVAELALKNEPYALVLLDLGLPKLNGLELLTRLRRASNAVPVLVLTARDAVSDRIKGLDAGADDYLVKPFDVDELAARMRALLRRQAGRAQPLITFGELILNPATHEVTYQGRNVTLTAREFLLLAALLEHPGAVLSKAQLEERLYGWDDEIESNTVEVHVYRLRKKLYSDLVHNIRGVGYMVEKNP